VADTAGSSGWPSRSYNFAGSRAGRVVGSWTVIARVAAGARVGGIRCGKGGTMGGGGAAFSAGARVMKRTCRTCCDAA
jgi:hypothetical protein